MNAFILYKIIYALAARDGRESALFGTCAPLAQQAFMRSLAGNYFPELWFELPLLGEPWFDLHALVSIDDLNPSDEFRAETTGNCPQAFAWFAKQDNKVRQLALSWDVSSGNIEEPAVQLLRTTHDDKVVCDFLTAVGRADAVQAYQAFAKRIPTGWFACYAGIFPRRKKPFLRVECIPDRRLQEAYAQDKGLLEAHLVQTGLTELGDTLVARCQKLAATPFQFEFQFDVDEEGLADETLGASVRFAPASDEGLHQEFDPEGAAGELMRLVEQWGLADKRWHHLADTIFSKQITHDDEISNISCYPTFIKLRWRNGQPLDAKAYLVAGCPR